MSQLEKFYSYEQTKSLLAHDFPKLLKIFEGDQPRSVRVNTLRHKVSEYKKISLEMGIELEPINFIPEGFFVNKIDERSHSWWSQQRLSGNFYGQGSASMLPAKILLPTEIEPDLRVLDATAAPGSKTTQMGSMLNNEGLILANDRKAHRLYALHRNVQMMGITNTVVTQIDARYLGERWPKTFDYVLLDGPCSATGSNRRNPFASRDEQHYKAFQTYQKSILKSVLNTLKDENSYLVYSTCSLLPIENELVLTPFLKKEQIEIEPITIPGWKHHPGLTQWKDQTLPDQLKNAIRIYPYDNNSDAFFIAKIRRL